MSSDSDSEFFDAEDTTPIRTIRSQEHSDIPVCQVVCQPKPARDKPTLIFNDNCNSVRFPALKVTEEDLKEAERKVKENEKRRKKVEQLRERMLNDEDEILEVPSDQSSLASSLEGVYPSSICLNILKDKTGTNSAESQSIMSLGKVGSILGEKDGLSIDSREHDTISHDTKYSVSETESLCDLNSVAYAKTGNFLKCPEPDVVASTKCDRPVAPPRRRKKKVVPPLKPSDCHQTSNTEILSQEHLKEDLRELECSLDLHSATRGQYVVKPQDREQDRAEGPQSNSSAHFVTDFETELSGHSPKNTCKGIDSESNSRKESNSQPYVVRTRSDSGRPLTDQEILEQVSVINLDTGEKIPLSLAEECLPKCLNPLSLHIMRLTSEYVSNSTLDKDRESDEENADARKLEATDAHRVWKKAKEIRKVIRGNMERTVNQLRSVANQVYNTRHGEDDANEIEVLSDVRSSIKIKVSSSHKRPSEFDRIHVVQELSGEHTGAIWTMKFSSCGRLLATAGQDHDLRIWVLKDSFNCFDDMRQKYNTEVGKSSPTPSQESIPFQVPNGGEKMTEIDVDDAKGPFMSKPFCRYKGHTAELLDVSWSKNYFILSSSMDKTVRLWHISRQECLCCFQHIDFVTAIAFHPRDDRFFLSGSLDGKLRLWNIPDKKVTLWNELGGQTKLITAVNFCQNGKIAIVGSYDGRCIFYNTEQLKYYTQIHVRSTRGKNAQGRKISGIEAMPGENKILVTSNDSRIRLYDLQDLSLTCKYKGYVNLSSQIKAGFSHDGKYIISGSENQSIYIWKTSHDYTKFSSVRRDRNDYWEAIKAHNAVVTSAVFAPKPSLILKQLEQEEDEECKGSPSVLGSPSCYFVVSADFSGIIKVFLLRSKNGSSSLTTYAN